MPQAGHRGLHPCMARAAASSRGARCGAVRGHGPGENFLTVPARGCAQHLKNPPPQQAAHCKAALSHSGSLQVSEGGT